MSIERADVVVIGAGANGAAIAYHLASKGVRNLLLIEKGAIAAGPTGMSSALVRHHYGDSLTAQLARDSLRFFETFDQTLGAHSDFQKCGAISVGSEVVLDRLRAMIREHDNLVSPVHDVDTHELRALEPEMDLEGMSGGLWESEAGFADPVGTCAGFVKAAQAKGLRCWFNTTVHDVVLARGRVAGVRTTRGMVQSDRVVIAAGPWTLSLVKNLGISLPITATRHSVVTFLHSGEKRPKHIVFDLDQGMYLRPEGQRLTLVGSMHSRMESTSAVVDDVVHDPDSFETRPTFELVSNWTEKFLHRYPQYLGAAVHGGWCGLYDQSRDWHHIIDEAQSAEGCWLVCGTSGHGFKTSPAVCDAVSDAVLGLSSKYDIRPFGLSRFAETTSLSNQYADVSRPF